MKFLLIALLAMNVAFAESVTLKCSTNKRQKPFTEFLVSFDTKTKLSSVSYYQYPFFGARILGMIDYSAFAQA